MAKRIVITSFGSYGDVYPYIGLGLELKARGHAPVLAMPGYYRTVVEREGLSFHPVRPDIDPADRETLQRVMDPVRGTEYIATRIIVASLTETYADVAAASRGADLLVTHPITFAAVILAQARGIPWVSTVLAPISFFSAHDVPVFPPAPWMKGLDRIPGAGRALVAIGRQATARWMGPVYAFRQQIGLPPGGNPFFEGQHSPQAVLALFPRVMAEPQRDWPPAVHITGAIPYNGPAGAPPLTDELNAFLDAGPAPLVFTLGSSAVGAAGHFYQESVDAVRRLGLRAVMLVGPYPENRPEGSLPDDVLLQVSAPHAALFPRAAAVVHQCGAGTMYQALRAGRPTLAVPFAHDQPDNAYRLGRLGVARTVRPRRYRARLVARELRRLLDDAAYRARAAAVAERVRAEVGARAACDVIETVL